MPIDNKSACEPLTDKKDVAECSLCICRWCFPANRILSVAQDQLETVYIFERDNYTFLS